MPTRQGLPRSRRLARPAQFSVAMKQGQRVRDEYFSVFGISNFLLHGRLGLTVSKKVSLRAVDRNRIKRQVRESFRAHQADMTGLDVVVMATPQARNAGAPALRQSLHKHWERIAQQCKKS
ncbi:MAG: ribonuclease P protein component [Gammaproteobacteria bacterium]|nr:ribonuclease P protein component [Gammaproteobacteria bacterium]